MSTRALAGLVRLAPLAMAALLVGCPRPDPLPLLDSGAEGDASDVGTLDMPAVERDVPEVGVDVPPAPMDTGSDVPDVTDVPDVALVTDDGSIDTGIGEGGATDADVAETGPVDTGSMGVDVPDTGAADTGTPCAAGQQLCSGRCVTVLTDPLNCNGCGMTCPGAAGATATCVGGVCSFQCAAGAGDCDGVSGNGCETNTTTAAAHCGRCGMACPVPANSAAVCIASSCGITCTAGFGSCDGTNSNGCEANLQTNTAHCGMCGRACPTAQTCVAGSCVPRCPAGMQFIPAGMFQMGASDIPAAVPLHGVQLSAFCMDTTEVTVSAYASCPRATCTTPDAVGNCNWEVAGREQYPLNCVDWNQARAYCQSRGGDLPTEAQWEYAARGTDGRLYPWGNDAPGSQLCWSGGGTVQLRPCNVRSFPSGNSPFGLFDMAGNVWEWTLDYSAPYTGSVASYVLNPTGPASGSTRVYRGGSWSHGAAVNVRASVRYDLAPTSRNDSVGFRCARGAL